MNYNTMMMGDNVLFIMLEPNQIGCVMVNVYASSTIDRGVESNQRL